MNEAAVAAEVVANGAPEYTPLGLQLRRAVHCLRRELVELHQVLHHSDCLVERAVAAQHRAAHENCSSRQS